MSINGEKALPVDHRLPDHQGQGAGFDLFRKETRELLLLNHLVRPV